MTSRKGKWMLGLWVVLLSYMEILAGTTGKITGRITDEATHEGLPGTNVIVVGTAIGATSDAEGYYTIINVPPGQCDLAASMVGYARTTVQGVKVNIDRTTVQNIVLSQQAIEGQTVTITAERPLLERDRTSTVSYTDAETIQDLPVTTLSEIIQLQAGVVTGESGEMHFRGGRQREVAYMVDGVPITNAYSQSGGQNISVENAFIRELQVISGTFNAEYGSAQSGVVNIVTKNPEDRIHGSVQIYGGDHVSNQNDIYLGIDHINPLAEKDVQATLTGPIWRKKLGFLASVRLNENESYYWYERRFNPLDGWKIDAYRRWYREHYASTSAQSAVVPIPDSLQTGDRSMGPLTQSRAWTFSGKLTFTPLRSLTLSYSLFSSLNKTQGGGAARRYQPDGAATAWGYGVNHIFSLRHMLTDRLFYNLHLSYQNSWNKSYYRKDYKIADYPGDSGIQPIYASSNGFSLGSTDGGYTSKSGKNYIKQYMANGDINWQIDRRNLIKMGFEIKQHRVNTYYWPMVETEEWNRYKYTTAIKGTGLPWNTYWERMVDYWKNWDATYQTTKYRYPRPDEITRYRDYDIQPMEAALYLQDKVEMGEIVLNAGVRLDFFQANERYVVNNRMESYLLGDPINLREAPMQYHLSPRLGFSFPVSDKGAFHVAYGHFFQHPSFETMYNEPLRVLSPPQLAGMRLGNCRLKPERTVSYEVGLQQGLGTALNADLTLFYKDFRNQLGIEAVTTVDAVGYTRYVNRDYGNVKGITIALETLPQGFLSGGFDYTFQYANGSASDPTFLQLVQAAARLGAEPVQFIERQILPLDWDQRHTLNATAILSFPGNWSASLITSIGSGLPYTPTSVGTVLFPDREFKNTARRPIRWNVDLKAKKRLTLSGIKGMVYVHVYNLFDHLNQNRIYTTSGNTYENAMLPEQRVVRDERLAEEGIFTPHEIDNKPEWYSPPRKIQIGFGVDF